MRLIKLARGQNAPQIIPNSMLPILLHNPITASIHRASQLVKRSVYAVLIFLEVTYAILLAGLVPGLQVKLKQLPS